MNNCWSPAEDGILADGIANGMEPREIADLLPERTITAVRVRRRKVVNASGGTLRATWNHSRGLDVDEPGIAGPSIADEHEAMRDPNVEYAERWHGLCQKMAGAK